MNKPLRFTLLASLLCAGNAMSADIGWNNTAGGTYDYNDPANWVGGTPGDINGIFDSSLEITATQNITFGADTTLDDGLRMDYTGDANLIFRGIGGNRVLTLGDDIIFTPATNRTLTIGSTSSNQGLAVDLGGATRTITLAQSRTMSFVNGVSNGGLDIIGRGASVNFTGGLNASSLSVSSTTVTFNGTSASNTTDTILGALSLSGAVIIGVKPNAATNARVQAGSFSRADGTSVLFRGNNLGVNNAGTGTDSSNITFTTAPTLVGGAGTNGTDEGIIAGAYGDTSWTGTGVGTTGGLVTYDATKGVRLVTNYSSAIVDGQSQLDNVRITNTGGAGIKTTNLTQNTTINSLSFDITGTGADGGIVVTGNAGVRLTVNSGMIYATQLITTPSNESTNSPVISVPLLDLAGKEGHIIAGTSGLTTQRGGAVLEISSEITNDGGKGVTFSGTGVTKLTGSAVNSYTGVTTVNSGVLLLAKSVDNIAITGDLVINGGAVEDSNNEIADTSNITINAGSFKLQIGNEGQARSETFNNLVMNGGTYVTGASGHTGNSNILGNATLAGGTISFARRQTMTVQGLTTLSGGVIRVAPANSTAGVYDTNATLNGGLLIENTAQGTYTPITLQSSTTNTANGGRLILGGDVTFTGNGTNNKTVTIAAPTGLGSQGVIALNGARTFSIGNGAAAQDLTVEAPLTNFDATVGSLIKTGAGTMLLQGVNTYTGDTTITEGRLQLGSAASIASSLIDIKQGGIYDTTSQDFAMSNGQTFKFTLDGTAGTAGLLDAGSLDITNGVVDFDSVGSLDDSFYIIASYTSLTGTVFASIIDLPTGYNLDYNFLGGNDIALVAVPEPSAGILILAGLASFFAARRTRSPRCV